MIRAKKDSSILKDLSRIYWKQKSINKNEK